MRTPIYLFLIALLAFNVVALGEVKKIDINIGETITVDLKTKDGVELNLMGGRHIINVNKIHEEGADLDVFTFVDGEQKVGYVTVNRKQSLKLDLDKDGRGEIYVKLNKFFKYDAPDGSRADGISLDFFYPSGGDFEGNEITGRVVSENDVGSKGNNFIGIAYLVGLFVVIIGVVAIFGIFLNKKRESKK